MASFLRKMKELPKHAPHGTAKPGFTGFLVDKGERYAASFAFGYAKGNLHEKFLFKGHGLDLWIGAGLTLLAGGMKMYSGGRSSLASHIERVGDAGVMSAFNSLGAQLGMKSAGRSVQVSTPGKNAPSLPTGVHGIGYIPAAMGGAYLSADEITNYAARR